jgi:hypothetical protein
VCAGKLKIVSEGAPWTTEIITELNCPVAGATRFWTAWADPEHESEGWRDPLVLKPFTDTQWNYSNRGHATPQHGDFISIPLATVTQAEDTGLSFVLSPESAILELSLETSASGRVRFVHAKHRLGNGKAVRFTMDLVHHEACWRGGLRWMTGRYPEFFNPPNPRGDELAGCGEYSGYEGPIDVVRLKAMGFRVNWKLSDDFVYMGMFIPPVGDADETWERSCDELAPEGKTRLTSARRMNDYARRMKQEGFHVLDYFNVTEFGKLMDEPDDSSTQPDDPELWKDPRAFLQHRLPDAALQPRQITFYKAVVTDCGDPAYRDFLIEQAERDVRMIPDSDGICIDRLDWLHEYNRNADDGISWVDGKPALALTESWKNLLEKLGPVMREAGKVIFCNPMAMRLDLMRGIDGFYTEYGESGCGLNSMSFLALRKTAITWTGMSQENAPTYDLLPDPDAFFQRHLYMGVYPTVPFPFNNHAIRPQSGVEEHYAAYATLLNAMRGKKWVLAPRCVEVAGNAAKANLFQVPGKYVLPVVFARDSEFVEVTVRNISLSADAAALHPGVEARVPVLARREGVATVLRVPIHHGCAMVLWR